MKLKTLLLLLITQLTLSLTSLGAEFTYEYEGHTLKYTPNEDGTTATVTGYYGYKPAGDLVIPATVNDGSKDYTVSAIGAGRYTPGGVTKSLSNCTYLTSVTFPEGLKIIGNHSFYGCTSLSSVTIPEGLETIGNSAFTESLITTVTIPKSMTSIGESAFYKCRELNSVIMHDGIKSIGIHAFFYCEKLESITIPDGVTSIGAQAFLGSGLKSVTLPKDLTEIGFRAFYDCNLESIRVNSTVLPTITDYYDASYNTIGGVFGDGTYTNNIYLPIHLMKKAESAHIWKDWYSEPGHGEYLGHYDNIVYRSPDLSKKAINIIGLLETPENGALVIPRNIPAGNSYYISDRISENAFKDCTGITSVTILEYHETQISKFPIGRHAFSGCTELTSVKLSKDVTYIDNYTFYGCNKLNSINIEDYITSIGDYAFYGCAGLTSLEFLETTKAIGDYAFSGCTGLTSIKVNNTSNPAIPIKENTFSDSYDTATLNYHYGVTDYTTGYWANFTNSIVNLDEILAFTYNEEELTATITGLKKTVTPGVLIGDIKINSTTVKDGKEYTITAIGDEAFSGCSSITSITIPESVTSIGNGAFYKCRAMTSATIPNGVTKIADSLFGECIKLSSITLPNRISSIGNNSFDNCDGLVSIVIPESVTSIGTRAFKSCENLISVTLPEGITTISESTFYESTKLATVNFPSTLTSIESSAFESCALTSVILPEGLKTIGDQAFRYNTELEILRLPSTLTEIGKYTFDCNENIQTVYLSPKLTTIGDGAFNKCSSLTSVVTDNTEGISINSKTFNEISSDAVLYIPYGCSDNYNTINAESVNSIWSNYFKGGIVEHYNNVFTYSTNEKESELAIISCDSSIELPAEFTIPSTAYKMEVKLPITAIADGNETDQTGVFSDCTNFTSIAISEGIKTIGSYAFRGCSELKSVTLPSSVETIGHKAFNTCNIDRVFINATNVPMIQPSSSENTIGDLFGDGTYSNNIYIPFGTKADYLAADIWKDWDTGEYIEFADNLTYEIDTNAKTATVTGYLATPTNTLTIPETVNSEYAVTAIADGAFSDCIDITALEIPSNVTTIGESTFSGCTGITALNIPSNVTTIGESAFSGCTNISTITAVGNAPTIYENTFNGCYDAKLIYPYAAKDGYTSGYWSKFNNSIVDYNASFTFSYNADKLTATLTGFDGNNSDLIGDIILNNTTIYNNQEYTITAIGANAFSASTAMTSINIPDGVTTIDDSAFNGCSLLSSIEISQDVTAIGDNAFNGCTTLANVTVNNSYPNTITLGANAFNGISESAILNVPEGSQDEYAESDWGSYFGGGINEFEVEYDDSAAFTDLEYSYDFESKSATIVGWTTEPTGVLTIPRITEHDGITYTVTAIADKGSNAKGVFMNCSGITSLILPKTLNRIGDYAFRNCAALETVKFVAGSQLTSLGTNVFYLCRELSSINIPEGVTEIGSSCFSYCNVLTSIDIPEGVTEISNYTFWDCLELTSIDIPSGVKSIGNLAFHNCKKLKSIYIPKEVTTIGNSAFQYCDELESVTFAEDSKLISLGDYVFSTCEVLTSIDIPNGVTSIGKQAFYFCRELKSVTLPAGLTSIGEGAFYNCDLTSIALPEGLESISNKAFNLCSSLATVVVNNSEPDAITLGTDRTFSGISSSAVLYVPEGSKTKYDESAAWTKYFKPSNIKEFESELTIVEGENITLTTADPLYSSLIIEDGAELNAEQTNLTILNKLIIERTFTYADGVGSNQQWFSLALPFAGVANGTLVEKFNETTQAYEPAICGEDYATFNYNGKSRADNGTSSTGDNWDMLVAEGDALGELIQFAEDGTHKYRFTSPNAVEAKAALQTGRTGSTYFEDITNDDDEGWNIVPAGKTYSTDAYDIYDDLASIQLYNSVTGNFDTQLISDIDALKPGTAFAVKLEEEYTAQSSTLGSSDDAKVEHYTFELVAEDGTMLDRIYLFDGSNQSKYRLIKMSALNPKIAQMAINVDGKNYCTYSTLASELDKSYTVTLANTAGATLVMKAAGSETVTVEGAATTINTPIEVADGEIVIKIDSNISGVDSVNGAIHVTGSYGTINISGAAAGTTYAITTTTGVTTYGKTTAATTKVAKPAGIYIVKIANQATKVIVK